MTRRLGVALGAAALVGTAAWAEGEAVAGASPGYYIAQSLLSLIIVVAVIYGLHFALQRRVLPGLRPRGQGPARIVQSLPLGGGHALHVVEMGQRTLVIGSGPGGVRTLAELDGAPASDPARSERDGE